MMSGRNLHLLGALVAVLFVRGAVVFFAAFVVTALVKSLSAETRHLIWLGVIASFLLIPLAWLVLPAVRFEGGIAVEPASRFRLAAAPLLSRGEYTLLVTKAGTRAADQASAGPIVGMALILVWLAGAVGLLVRLPLGAARLRKLCRSAASAGTCYHLRVPVKQLAEEMAVRRHFTILASTSCSIPFTFGVFKPVIFLPASCANWSEKRTRSAITHELAHIRRWDVLTQAAAYWVCSLFWFFPPVWLAYSALLCEAETCCDRKVIEGGIRAPAYARDIAALATGCVGRILAPCISSVMGRRHMLSQRIRKVLDLRPGQPPFGTRAVLRVVAALMCCLVPLIALTAQAKPAGIKLEDPLFGTWINEEYDRATRSTVARVELFSDGRELDYEHITDAEPSYESKFAVEEVWDDAQGNRWYKIHWSSWLYPSGAGKVTGYTLSRIDSAGTTWEAVWAGDRYPEPSQLNPLGPGYGIMFKRK